MLPRNGAQLVRGSGSLVQTKKNNTPEKSQHAFKSSQPTGSGASGDTLVYALAETPFRGLATTRLNALPLIIQRALGLLNLLR